MVLLPHDSRQQSLSSHSKNVAVGVSVECSELRLLYLENGTPGDKRKNESEIITMQGLGANTTL